MGTRRRLTTTGALLALAGPLVLAAPGAAGAEAEDPYRPQLHFAPERNWVNDPNGPVWYEGEYHLYFQHNPEGTQWGNMSWGHAVSTDLVTWEERPLALRFTEDEHVFSGSVVVDHENTSGFGSGGRPPLVAVYTSFDPRPGRGVQAQSLAYSTDGGDTWTRYAGNPVLDIGSTEFRDPKVFWYEDGGYWVMAVALATEHRVRFYRSDDLRAWEHLSDFGPANAVGGVWEMPDLFELPVDGDPDDTRWVLVLNLNPGAVAGGSGAQYFLGDFDGTRFTAQNVVTDLPGPPAGDVLADFEGAGYGDGWRTTGTAFGTGPVRGTLPGQHPVQGFVGTGLVNSFVDGDRSQGTLTSPPFTLTRDHVNLLVGGGAHPHVPGTGDGAPPDGVVLADFEGDDFGGWTAVGDAFGAGPVDGDVPCQVGVTGYLGDGLANGYHDAGPAGCGDGGTGTLTSPVFEVTHDHLSFLLGGGDTSATGVRLLVDGEAVRTATGPASGTLNWAGWDVRDLRGRRAQVQLFDESTGGWGHVLVDHVVLSDAPASPRSTQTGVNLLVDGEVVRTATGTDSETLRWVSWDVEDLVGSTARLQAVDHSSGGWGHVLLDEVTLADEPVPNPLSAYDWVDHGKDSYASLSFENVPGDRRISIGWMNNWQYAAATPTGDWRGSMTLPRELSLRTVDGRVRLVQEPACGLTRHTVGRPFRLRDVALPAGVRTLPSAARGTVLEVTAEVELGTADEVGLHVRVGDGERTVVGYDVDAAELFVDRTRSGRTDLHPEFPGVHRGLLTPDDGRVRLRVVVDRSSVEVFGGEGETVVTDLVYPRLSSDGLALYAEGGQARLVSLEVRRLG